MGFDATGLNNISGSMGRMNLWMYNTNDTQATVIAADYFLEACESYSMRSEDIIIFAASDHRVLCQVYYDGTNATTAALTDHS